MFKFLKLGTCDQVLDDFSAKLNLRIRKNEQGTVEIEGENEVGFFHDMSLGGTGLYSDHEFKIGSTLIFDVKKGADSDEWTKVGFQVLWSRLQDRDNIAAICIRRMIFSQYEEQGKTIEADVLQLLHSPGRSSTDQLIQRFSIFTLDNLKVLDGLKNKYIESHPQTSNRFGAKVIDEYKESWQDFSKDFFENEEDEPEEASDTMKQFNRRSAQR